MLWIEKALDEDIHAQQLRREAFWKKHANGIIKLLDEIGKRWVRMIPCTNGLENCYWLDADRTYQEIRLSLWHGRPDMTLDDGRVGDESQQPMSGSLSVWLVADNPATKPVFVLYHAAGRANWDCSCPDQFTEVNALRARIKELWTKGLLVAPGIATGGRFSGPPR